MTLTLAREICVASYFALFTYTGAARDIVAIFLIVLISSSSGDDFLRAVLATILDVADHFQA